jgi:hypothetical protein
MGGSVRFADDEVVTVTCCNRILNTIQISTPRGPLAVAHCDRCERRRWYHNGTETQLREVLRLAATDWRNTRLWRSRPHLQLVR